MVIRDVAATKASEVEFVTLAGETVAVVTLPAEAVRELRADEIVHARAVVG